ncbi:MAG: asparaginase domain-containing protein, partial [Candidatus Thalassarchaeaceae archaeon]
SSDAAENLISAVYWAAHGPEVTGHRDSAVVVMHDGDSDGRCAVLPGCASRKSHSSKRGAFRSVNQEPVAYVALGADGPRIEDSRSTVSEREIADGPMLFDEGCRIHELVAGPHLSPDLLEAVIGTSPDAMIVRGTGLGHIPILDPLGDSPENGKVADALSKAVEKGIPVVVTAETVHGPVNMNVYAKGRNQRSIGLIGHGSMCPPGSAVVKLHYLLSKGLDINGVREAWEVDLVGENPPDSSS